MARPHNPFEEDALPPFTGFPPDALRFFAMLRKNNTREWFAGHRSWYEDSVKFPMLQVLGSLGESLRDVDPDIVLDPPRALYRLYRDIRFSKDKSPFKTQIAAAFGFRGKERKNDAGFYFHISDQEVGIGGGLYMPRSDQLRALRQAIAADARPLRALLAARTFRSHFGELWGDSLVRVPQGFPPDHPDADLLRRKQFLCWASIESDIVYDSSFLRQLTCHMRAMAPFVRWISEHS